MLRIFALARDLSSELRIGGRITGTWLETLLPLPRSRSRRAGDELDCLISCFGCKLRGSETRSVAGGVRGEIVRLMPMRSDGRVRFWESWKDEGREKVFSLSEGSLRNAVGIGVRPADEGGVKYRLEGEIKGEEFPLPGLEVKIVVFGEAGACHETRFDWGGDGLTGIGLLKTELRFA